MTSQRALLLSLDGIALLEWRRDRWVRLGVAALDDGDLDDAMAGLRQKAGGSDAAPVEVLLVIPNDQIRYLDLGDPGGDASQRAAAVRRALEGATPYAVDDLVFDWIPAGGRLQVAVVARETLDEAEGFATAHAFAPVSHVANPPPDVFDGVVFFGATEYWSGAPPKRPDGPVAAQGDAAPTAEARTDGPGSEDARTAAPAIAEAAEVGTVTDHDSPAAAPDRPPEVTGMSEAASSESSAGARANTTAGPARPSGPVYQLTERAAGPVGFAEDPPGDDDTPAFSSVRAQRDVPPRRPGRTLSAATSTGSADKTGRSGRSVTDPRLPPDPAVTHVPAARPAQADRPAPPPASPPRPAVAGPVPKRVQITPTATGGKAAPTGATSNDGQPEHDRMTIFGARNDQRVGGKPRFLGLMLTTALLIVLVGVAAWAAVFLDDGIARLFRDRSGPPAATAESATGTAETRIADDPEARSDDAEIAALDARPEADPRPEPRDGAAPEEGRAGSGRAEAPTPEEAEAAYADTGIWQRAPAAPLELGQTTLEDLYVASIDPKVVSNDAVALPAPEPERRDLPIDPVISPPPAGTVFDLDDRGLVRATPEGAATPQGVIVYSGEPPAVPPRRADGASLMPLEETEESVAARAVLQRLRPVTRPGDLIEQNERANLGGVSLAELGRMRPALRPQSVQEEQAPEDDATDLAVVDSPAPVPRPRDFGSIVDRAVAAARAAPEPQIVSARAPRTVAPSIPSSASVAREATMRNVLRLNRLNLIGVYGTPSNRRALVRMANGRYEKVKVGDRIDGGRVAAIGEAELRYQKGGRSVVLKMPGD